MKKNYLVLSLLAAATLMVTSCGGDDKKSVVSNANASELTISEKSTFEEKSSYAVGASVGTYISTIEKEQKEVLGDFNRDLVIQGFKDALNGKIALEDKEMQDTLITLDTKLREGIEKKQKDAALQTLKEGEEFLKDNAKKEGVKTTESGLQYKVLVEGKGKTPAIADTVLVRYKGTNINGEVFDEQKEPIALPLANIIPGWTEGLQLMKEGGKMMLYIPSDLAYAEMGAGDKIKPNAALVFEIELVQVVSPKQEEKK